MTRRSRVAGYGTAGGLVVAGGVCAAVFAGEMAQILAFVFIALGLVLAVSLVFLEVGLSEDRDRARTQQSGGRPGRRPRPRRGSLERRRGQRRSL
jgi:hypothetical protein